MTTTSTSAPRTSSSSQPSMLRDQLAQFNGANIPTSGSMISGRSVLGWFLTLCGIAISAWIAFTIHAAIFHPEHLGLPLRILQVEDLTMTIPSGKIQLPAEAVILVGYLLTVMLLAIAGKIAISQIKLGASLLSGEKIGSAGDSSKA